MVESVSPEIEGAVVASAQGSGITSAADAAALTPTAHALASAGAVAAFTGGIFSAAARGDSSPRVATSPRLATFEVEERTHVPVKPTIPG